MKDAKNIGRIIGVMLLVQLAGLIVPFALLSPLMTSEFMTNAAQNAAQVKAATLLLLANCALTIGISFAAYRVFRQHSPSQAVLLAALSAIMFTLQAVDNAHVMSMLSLSQEYARAAGSNEFFQTLSATMRAARRWTHYAELLAIDAWFFALYGILYRTALVPRALAVFGMITVLIHFASIPLPLMLGYGGTTILGAILALSHISLALWLIIKGFKEERGLA
jgi:Domain of unknown function (DUF4386)